MSGRLRLSLCFGFFFAAAERALVALLVDDGGVIELVELAFTEIGQILGAQLLLLLLLRRGQAALAAFARQSVDAVKSFLCHTRSFLYFLQASATAASIRSKYVRLSTPAGRR